MRGGAATYKSVVGGGGETGEWVSLRYYKREGKLTKAQRERVPTSANRKMFSHTSGEKVVSASYKSSVASSKIGGT